MSDGTTSSVMVLPVNVFTKTCGIKHVEGRSEEGGGGLMQLGTGGSRQEITSQLNCCNDQTASPNIFESPVFPVFPALTAM